jgi:uncharacterized protein
MSQAGVIDSLQFARERGERRGSLDLHAMPRLAHSGCKAAMLSYVLQGGRNENNRPSLHLEVAGPLMLECQRCLGPLEFPLAVSNDLELAASQAEIDAADDSLDRVLASPQMDVAELVEDEAILALPMISMHEHCVDIDKLRDKPHEDAPPSPFAALAALKRK